MTNLPSRNIHRPGNATAMSLIIHTPEQHLAHTRSEIARFKELSIPVRDV
jgi:hypothetical protein